MRWPKDAKDWPMVAHSQVIDCKPHRWHVQSFGQGKTLLLIHGAGGATQSWRKLAPVLAKEFHVICVDLPGQGFTQAGAQNRFGLTAMAEDLMALCNAQSIKPHAIIGHSAGAAVALRMNLLGFQTGSIIGINSALEEFRGLAGWLFPVTAKLLAAIPFAAATFSAGATQRSVAKLLDGTGSKIGPSGQKNYLRLIKDKAHVDATLSMMAQWDLKPLLRDLHKIETKVVLLAGENDRTVPPETSRQAALKLKNAQYQGLNGLGHLAHEEAAATVAEAIKGALGK